MVQVSRKIDRLKVNEKRIFFTFWLLLENEYLCPTVPFPEAGHQYFMFQSQNS